MNDTLRVPAAFIRRLALTLAGLSFLASLANAAPRHTAALEVARVQYASRPSAERVEVTHRAGAVQRTESMTVAILPPHNARLEFGPYIVFVDDQHIRVIHQQDTRGFVEHPMSPGGPLATLEELFPPLPLPQLYLALTPPDGELALTPYCADVSWSLANRTSVSGKLELTGKGSRVAAHFILSGAGGSRLRIESDQDREIDVESTPIEGYDFDGAMRQDFDARQQVSSIALLRPRPGDSGEGAALPPLQLVNNFGEELPAQPPVGPCVLLFFGATGEAVAPAQEALVTITRRRPSVPVWPIFVTDILETRLSYRLEDVAAAFAPLLTYFTLSPTTTVERFSEESRDLLVVVDAQSVVRAIVPLNPPTQNAEELTAQILAALDESAAPRR